MSPVGGTSHAPSGPDFNGDGKTDIIGRAGADVHVALSNGSSFNGSTRWTVWQSAYTLGAGDFNGDA